MKEGIAVADFNVSKDEVYTEGGFGAEAEESQAEFSVLILFIISWYEHRRRASLRRLRASYLRRCLGSFSVPY
jgi:hypothetical protein